MPDLLSDRRAKPLTLLSRPSSEAERRRAQSQLRKQYWTDPVYGCVEWYQYDRANAADRTGKRGIRH
jgi:hypothetical protein